ncbi:MAG TPA: phage tail sheath subtilisin-like domain-containing protein [Longimicrobiales bacterium]
MQTGLTAPGLYVAGIETPPAPPLESAVTGFVGIAERGPLNVPQPILGWSDYVDTFGGFVPFGYLAESVFGFFRNGGAKCWVVRVADTGRAGVAPESGRCARVEPLAAAAAEFVDHRGDATLRVVALDPGGWGNRLEVRVSDSAAAPIAVGVLTQPTTEAATELFLDSVVDLRPGARIRITAPDGVTGARELEIQPGATALEPSLGRVGLTTPVGAVFDAGSPVFAAGFRIEAAFDGRVEVFDRLSLRPAHERYFQPLINGLEPVTDYAERRRRGLSTLIRVEHLFDGGASHFRPASTPPRALAGGGDGFVQATATFLDAGSNPVLTVVATKLRGSVANGLEVVARPFAARTAVPIPDAAGARDRIVVDTIDGFVAGETVQLVDDLGDPPIETAVPALVEPDAHRLRLGGDLAAPHPVGRRVAVADRFTLVVRRPGEREPLEVIRNLSGEPAAGDRFVRTALAAQSTLLCADAPAAPFTTPLPAPDAEVTVVLDGGADPGEIDARFYTGYEADGTRFHPPGLPPGSLVGLAALEAVDEVSLVAVPDLVRLGDAALTAAQRMVLRHCARMGDRFALLDAPAGPSPTPEDWVAGLRAAAPGAFGAAYHPWIRSSFGDATRLTPPSGFVAGIFARSDALRGVNKAPANERVEGAFGLEPAVDRRRHGELNPLGINCVVKLEDGEVRLMGARTLSDAAASRYVSVRRTLLSVKRALSRRMLWTVFEPVGPALFRRIEATLTTYLETLLARGVTASQRPRDAFYVKCDEETNPAGRLHEEQVVAEVGIALLAPAEFIVLTARRTPDAVQVVETEA